MMRFINIEVQQHESETFAAVRLSKKQNEKYNKFHHFSSERKSIVPITDTFGNEKQVFAVGLGWINRTKTNVVELPHYDFASGIEGWFDYLEKYGIENLYYSISGKCLWDNDCCEYGAQREFISLYHLNREQLADYSNFIDCYNELIAIQRKADTPKEKPILSETDNSIQPSYCIMGICTTPPTIDPILCDKQFERVYRRRRHNELREQGKKYGEIEDILRNEIEDGTFPISVRDRAKYLYGERFGELLEKLLKWYDWAA